MYIIEKSLKEWAWYPRKDTAQQLSDAIVNFKESNGVDVCLHSNAIELNPLNQKRLEKFCNQQGDLHG